jgi:hypothetical protein
MTSPWSEITAAALIGTERQPPPPVPAGTAVGDLLVLLEGRDAEARLLAVAAAVSLYERGGRRPERDEGPLPSPAEAEVLPRCSMAAARHLGLMLSGRHREALPEWLRAAASAGRRAPEHLLPELIQAGRLQRDLRESILAVAGQRGRWLAAQNREWAYLATGVDEDGSWETGSRAARELQLGQRRAADPDAARELLAESWAQETADARVAFVQLLRVRLSMADEPFLEAALDDRSTSVRHHAADLLARLPESRLCARMWERVQPLIQVVPGAPGRIFGLGRKRASISVALPDECTKEMVRDGVERKPEAHDKQFGERAWWLIQMLGMVPPARWSEAAGVLPEALLEAAEGEWRAVLLHGWAAGAERARDPAWAEALLRAADCPILLQEKLFDVLAPARREALVLELLRKPLAQDHPAYAALRACKHPWSDPFSRAVLGSLRQRLVTATGRYTFDGQTAGVLQQMGLSASPALADEAQAGWAAQSPAWPQWSGPVDALVALLQFRREMLEEIRR